MKLATNASASVIRFPTSEGDIPPLIVTCYCTGSYPILYRALAVAHHREKPRTSCPVLITNYLAL
jgi:hypothetical protein